MKLTKKNKNLMSIFSKQHHEGGLEEKKNAFHKRELFKLINLNVLQILLLICLCEIVGINEKHLVFAGLEIVLH